MYMMQREIEAGGTRVRMVEGSIFEAEANGATGVAVFVPCGLTALRGELSAYLAPFGVPIGEEMVLKVYRKERETGAVTVLCDENWNMVVYDAKDIPVMLDTALAVLRRHGVHHVAMNGIRIHRPEGAKDYGHLAEALLVENALRWLKVNDHNFMTIDFVDMRGGFGKIDMEEPFESNK